MLDEICTAKMPKALAARGHDFPTPGPWGVLLGVARCRYCGVVARAEHFGDVATKEPTNA